MSSKDKPLFPDIDGANKSINSNIIALRPMMLVQKPRDNNEDNILAASNGKHENGDADYDYSDLGPETDVDATDDVATMPVKSLSYESRKEDDSSHDEDQPDKESNILDNDARNDETKIHKRQLDAENNRKKIEDETIAKFIALLSSQETVQNEPTERITDGNPGGTNDEVRERIDENADEENTETEEGNRVADDAQDVVDEAGPVDYDDSPPSPQANKPLQHALIPEADNVADSEDSEDEWNYYRVDPNKEKDSTTPVDEPQEVKTEEEIGGVQILAEDNVLEIQSQDIEEGIKCESPKEELSELINTEISTEGKEVDQDQEKKLFAEEQEQQSKDMDFQLNPNAAEFVPVSPPLLGSRMNLGDDYPISGSPLKQVSQMDDIQIPSQSEFEEEVCQRPREVETEEKEYRNGVATVKSMDDADFMTDRQKVPGFYSNLDDSEISSMKAEFGDESSTSFLTANDFHRTGISTIDESFSSSERDYDIAKDPMAMSFTPSDLEAAFDKGVDLNAVHNLSNTDFDDKNGIIEEEVLTAQSPELHSELTTLASLEAEQPAHAPAFPKEPAELVNLSSQQEDSEATFIEHADESKTTVDFLNLQSESSQIEQETARSDHSPLTENYSAEFESEKEAVSVDNEQLLSPSSVEIDETKPIDEPSEDAALPENYSQKELWANETQTPTSVSPVPETLERDLLTPVEKTEDSSTLQSGLHPDAPEFTPGHYNFSSFTGEMSDVCQSSSTEASDVCKSTLAETTDVCQSPPVETSNVFQSYLDETHEARQSPSAEESDVCELAAAETSNVCKLPAVETSDVCKLPAVETSDVCKLADAETSDVCKLPAAETSDVCTLPDAETSDVCKLPDAETSDVCKLPAAETSDVCKLSAAETNDVCELPEADTSDVCKLPDAETSDVCKLSAAETSDVCKLPDAETIDVCKLPTAETSDVCKLPDAETNDVCKFPAAETSDVCKLPTVEMSNVFQTSLVETHDVREPSPVESDDVCQSSLMETHDVLSPVETSNVFQSSLMETRDVYQTYPAETSNVFQSSLVETRDVRESSPVETSDIFKPTPVETSDAFKSSLLETRDVFEPSSIESNEVYQSPAMETRDVSLPVETSNVFQSSVIETFDVCQSSSVEASNVYQTSLVETSNICESVIPEMNDVCKSPAMEADDVREKTQPEKIEDDVQESRPAKIDDICEPHPAETGSVCELYPAKTDDTSEPHLAEADKIRESVFHNLESNIPYLEEKLSESDAAQQSVVQENLLGLVEEREVSEKVQVAVEPTPPSTPHNLEDTVAQNVDDMICSIKSALEQKTTDIVELKEEVVPVKTEVPETKTQTMDEPVKEPVLNLSESMQEFTGLECQLQPKSEDVPVSVTVPELQDEIPQKEEPIVAAEPEKPSVTTAVEEECKIQEEKKVEEVPVVIKEPDTTEPAIEVPENKVAEAVAVTAVAAAVVTGAVIAQNKTKAKPAAKSTKITATKNAQKSTPTSPSKTVSSTTRTSTTTAKKPTTTTTARPKDLDTAKKTTVSSTTSSKPTAAAKPSSKTATTSSTVTKSANRMSLGGGGLAAKPKPATTVTKTLPGDKKPTANGDVKSLNKPTAAAKPPTSKTTSATKSSLAKTTTARTLTGTTTTKKTTLSSTTTATKVSSTTAKSSTASTTTTTASSTRPKTAPTTGTTAKSRLSATAKSPIIDKQVKDTANKQISMARSSSATKTTRVSTSSATATTAKRLSITTKTTPTPSPITKKTAATSKISGRASTVGKTTTTEKEKVLQNGVSEKVEINAIIDDVPKKDLSPVVTPNDNQLIMSSD
ncbi:uncharacterized protein LOC143151346 isoform X2 [Ptiloglossa arizonensis]